MIDGSADAGAFSLVRVHAGKSPASNMAAAAFGRQYCLVRVPYLRGVSITLKQMAARTNDAEAAANAKTGWGRVGWASAPRTITG
ncbi:hypothetical protein TM102_26420 [Bradyrhizobium sp. TM102]|nr:hypothetical protein TM102_26420 [Bradyrhizobium sp. TM102]